MILYTYSKYIMKFFLLLLIVISSVCKLSSQVVTAPIELSFLKDSSFVEAQYNDDNVFTIPIKINYNKNKKTPLSMKIKVCEGTAVYLYDYKFDQGNFYEFKDFISTDSVITLPITIVKDKATMDESEEFLKLCIELVDSTKFTKLGKGYHVVIVKSAYQNEERKKQRLLVQNHADSMKKERSKNNLIMIGNWITVGTSVDLVSSQISKPVNLFFSSDFVYDVSDYFFGGLVLKSATFSTNSSSPEYYNGSREKGFINLSDLANYPIDGDLRNFDPAKDSSIKLNTGNRRFDVSSRYYSLKPYFVWKFSTGSERVNRFYLGPSLHLEYWNNRRSNNYLTASDELSTSQDTIKIVTSIAGKDSTFLGNNRFEYGAGFMFGFDYRIKGFCDIKFHLHYKYISSVTDNSISDDNDLVTLNLIAVKDKSDKTTSYKVKREETKTETPLRTNMGVLETSTVFNFQYYGGIQLGFDYRLYEFSVDKISNNYVGVSISKNFDIVKLYDSIFGT